MDGAELGRNPDCAICLLLPYGACDWHARMPESRPNRAIKRSAHHRDEKREVAKMTTTKRIFVGFAVEDKQYRDLLRGQSKLGDSPIDYTDMSAKEPWDSSW